MNADQLADLIDKANAAGEVLLVAIEDGTFEATAEDLTKLREVESQLNAAKRPMNTRLAELRKEEGEKQLIDVRLLKELPGLTSGPPSHVVQCEAGDKAMQEARDWTYKSFGHYAIIYDTFAGSIITLRWSRDGEDWVLEQIGIPLR